MHPDLVELGWSDNQWNRIVSAVTEEAQKGRVAAQMLPMVGPEDPTTVAVPTYRLTATAPEATPGRQRLEVKSDPTLPLTTIAVNVYLHTREAADPELKAALGMFRRAANYIARIEDALVFNGRKEEKPPALGLAGMPLVYEVKGRGEVKGLRDVNKAGIPLDQPSKAVVGDRVVTGIIKAINQLEEHGQLGPYACALSPDLFGAVCTPGSNLVLPRDRILPFLQGPLLRASALANDEAQSWGLVVALSGSPIELVVASDISVRYLQTSEEPRLIFRVAERVALRVKEAHAVARMYIASSNLTEVEDQATGPAKG